MKVMTVAFNALILQILERGPQPPIPAHLIIFKYVSGSYFSLCLFVKSFAIFNYFFLKGIYVFLHSSRGNNLLLNSYRTC